MASPEYPRTPAWPENTPDHWPIYHMAHPTATRQDWPIDPNPIFFYQGRYHLHYIYSDDTGYVFGHVSSTDMVHWTWHPTVLGPETTGHGMFSGTGFFTDDGQPAMVYHGEGSNRNWILYALDDDLNEWSEPQLMLPRDADGELMEDRKYFDPDIWRMDGAFYGLNGVCSTEPPELMKSDDLKEWTYLGEFLHPDFDEEKLGVKKSEDISCPQMFRMGGKWVLVCISHRLGCRYFVGDFKDEKFLPEFHALIGGNSNRYFAPESVFTPDGRCVNWVWFIGHADPCVLSLPTELELHEDGVMRFRPIRELESLRYDETQQENVAVGKDAPMLLDGIRGDHMELKLEIADTGDQNFGLDIWCDAQGESGLRIQINREANLLDVGEENGDFTLAAGEPLELRVFIDGPLVEVFANERLVVMADQKREAGTPINDRVSVFSAGRDLTIDRITAWQMKSAYPTE